MVGLVLHPRRASALHHPRILFWYGTGDFRLRVFLCSWGPRRDIEQFHPPRHPCNRLRRGTVLWFAASSPAGISLVAGYPVARRRDPLDLRFSSMGLASAFCGPLADVSIIGRCVCGCVCGGRTSVFFELWRCRSFPVAMGGSWIRAL